MGLEWVKDSYNPLDNLVASFLIRGWDDWDLKGLALVWAGPGGSSPYEWIGDVRWPEDQQQKNCIWKLSTQVAYGHWMGENNRTWQYLRAKTQRELTWGLWVMTLGLYTTTGCATWGLHMYSRAGQVISSMMTLRSRTYQKVLATD